MLVVGVHCRVLTVVSISRLAPRQLDRHPEHDERDDRNEQLVPPASFAVQQHSHMHSKGSN